MSDRRGERLAEAVGVSVRPAGADCGGCARGGIETGCSRLSLPMEYVRFGEGGAAPAAARGGDSLQRGGTRTKTPSDSCSIQ